MSKKKSHSNTDRLLLGDLVKSFLGPSRRIKCIEDEGGSRYFKHASLLLEHLDVEHPVFQYIISVSQEFRKQYGTGAADELLFYIHTWSRLATHLNEMGIPMGSVTTCMKEVINESIEHIDTRKINFSEVKEKIAIGRAKLSNFGAGLGDKNSSISTKLQKNEDVKKDPKIGGLSDGEVEAAAIEEDVINDSNVENNSNILHHIQEMVCDHDTTCNDKDDSKGCTQKEASTVEEDDIEIIHLEMKNVPSENEDFDDTSWFFDDEAAKDNYFETFENVISAQSKDTNNEESKTDKNGSICENLEDEEKSDDSGAILADIENLKRDIENDVKRLKERRKVKVCKDSDDSGQNMDQGHFDINDEFDSCFDDSDSDFSDCFEGKHVDRTLASVKEENLKSKNVAEDKDFITVEFTALKEEEKIKRKVTDSAQKMSPDVLSKNALECLKSEVAAVKAKKGPFDIEIQKCYKEYSKTKEILRIAENHETVIKDNKEIRENVKSDNSGNDTDLISCNTALTAIGGENLKIVSHAKRVDIETNNVDRQKQRDSSLNKGQIQQINMLLGSLGKPGKTNTSNFGASALKFRSRHFQDEMVKTSEENDIFVPSVAHAGCDSKNNVTEEMDNLTGNDNDSVGEESLHEKQCSNAKHDQAKAVLSKKLDVNSEKKSDSVNLESINRMLKGIKDISSIDKECKGGILSAKSEDISDDLMEFGSSFSSQLEIDHNKVKRVAAKFNISDRDNVTDSKIQSVPEPVSVKHSSIFLRSRHMNTESEINENNKVRETSSLMKYSDPVNQSTETIKGESGNTIDCTGNLTYRQENRTAVLKEEVGDLVQCVNYDGEMDVNRALCDILLKQSKGGNLRLNTELVDVYTLTDGHSYPLEVIEGVVVQTSIEKMMTLLQLQGKECRALLVNADLTMTFRHKGYKSVKFKEFSSLEKFTHGQSKQDSWQEDILNVLKMLSVNILLVKGNVSEDVVSICEQHHIVTLDTIPYKQLVQLSEATLVDMVTYVTLATQDNVCTGISVSPHQQNWCNKVDSGWSSKVDIVISLAENSPQTVILCGISPVLIDLKEQEFWSSLYHLSSVLHDGYLVPGSGQTEEDCARFLSERLELLKRHPKSLDSNKMQYKQIVLDSVISSFQDYCRMFRDNCCEVGNALQGHKSKIETLKLAIDTVISVINIDSYIVTGITEENVDEGTL